MRSDVCEGARKLLGFTLDSHIAKSYHYKVISVGGL
jgi:hypothetical protein